MATNFWKISCKCGGKFYLEDELTGECPSCGADVAYEDKPTAAKKQKKAAPPKKAASAEPNLEKAAGAIKFSPKE